MKCPLLLPIIYQLGGLPDGNEDECYQVECAWWDTNQGRCAILSMESSLRYLKHNLADLATKVPQSFRTRVRISHADD